MYTVQRLYLILSSMHSMHTAYQGRIVGLLALFSQVAAMVLLISPERIELEGCACAQIEALEKMDRSRPN